ncbi:hypothetical protein BDW75DRAFT_176103 [Aspergillus navahoensis]
MLFIHILLISLSVFQLLFCDPYSPCLSYDFMTSGRVYQRRYETRRGSHSVITLAFIVSVTRCALTSSSLIIPKCGHKRVL